MMLLIYWVSCDSVSSYKDAFIDTNLFSSQYHHLSDHLEEELHALQVQHHLPDGHFCG